MNARLFSLIAFAVFAFIQVQSSFAQQRGMPCAEYFSMDKIGVQHRIFAVASDADGLIYLAYPDIDLVRVFDGSNWTSIEVASPICLATDTKGTVWVGQNQSVGFFAKTEFNQIEYRQFDFESEASDLLEFYFAFATEHGVRLSNGRTALEINTRGIKPESKTLRTQPDEVFVGTDGIQLFSKTTQPAGIFSHAENRKPILENLDIANVDYVIPIDTQKTLLVRDVFTRVDLYENGHVRPFSKALSSKDLDVSCVLPMPGDRIGVASRGRFSCFDAKGNVLYQVDGKRGGQRIFRFGVMRDGRVWLATDDGFGLLDERHPIGSWPILTGKERAAYSFDIIDDNIYVGADQGLFQIPISEFETSWPKEIKPLVNYTAAGVFRFDDRLFAATMNGLMDVESGKRLAEGIFDEVFVPKVEGRDLVFGVTQDAHLIVFEWKEGGLHEISRSELNIQGSFEVQLNETAFILDSRNCSYSLVEFPNGFDDVVVQKDLVNESDIYGITNVKGELCCWNDDGIYELQYQDQALSWKAPEWATKFNQANQLSTVSRIIGCGDSALAIYDAKQKRIKFFPWNDGELQPNQATSWGFGNPFSANIMKWDDARDCLWTINKGSLIRMDRSYSEISAQTKPFIRARFESDAILPTGENEFTAQSGISFQFGLPYQYCLTNEPIQFQYKLRGNDSQWSDWSESTLKEYTNLAGGKYRFHVRAKDPLGRISEAVLPEFFVGTVWYLQNWFIVLLGLVALGLAYAASVFRTRKLTQANDRMEKLVALRTFEIESKTKEVLEKSALLHAKEIQSEAERLASFDTLVAGVAHDFNNLLTVILTNNEMIAIAGDDDSRTYAENSMKAIAGAIDLCTEMTAFSDRSPASLAGVSVVEAVTEMEHTLAKSVPDDVEFSCELPNKDMVSLADLNQLRRALLNLVINAGEAARSKVNVEVRTEELSADDLISARFVGNLPGSGTFHCIEVSDDGTGLDESVLNRMFDPFFSTKSFGRGLGLAIVLKIIGRHRGVVFVDSSPDGTTFCVCLPKTNVQPAFLGKPHFANKLPPLDVLIVDDDESVLNSLELLLTSQRHRVSTHTFPLQALEFLSGDEKLDLLIVDVSMPVMTGPELAIKVMEMRPELPILLVSGFNENWLQDELLKKENVSFLTKPLSKNRLNEKIYSLLNLQTRHEFSQLESQSNEFNQ